MLCHNIITPTDFKNLSALIICLLRQKLHHMCKLIYDFSVKNITHSPCVFPFVFTNPIPSHKI
jgi:hypothetical protein